MNSQLSVSKPTKNADGSYSVQIRFPVSGHPVVLNLRTRGDLAGRFQRLLSNHVSFGQNPYAETWKFTDMPIAAVQMVSRDPRIARVVQSVPYSSSVVAAVNHALGHYRMIKAGRRDILPKIAAAVRAGSAAARQLLGRIRFIMAADQLKTAAAQNNPAAIQKFHALSQGLSQGDPQAIEAFMVMDGLHRMANGQPLQPTPIQASYDWTGTEQLPALASKIAQAVHFGATNRTPPVARLRTQLAHVNAKDASAKRVTFGAAARRPSVQVRPAAPASSPAFRPPAPVHVTPNLSAAIQWAANEIGAGVLFQLQTGQRPQPGMVVDPTFGSVQARNGNQSFTMRADQGNVKMAQFARQATYAALQPLLSQDDSATIDDAILRVYHALNAQSSALSQQIGAAVNAANQPAAPQVTYGADVAAAFIIVNLLVFWNNRPPENFVASSIPVGNTELGSSQHVWAPGTYVGGNRPPNFKGSCGTGSCRLQ